MVLISKSRTARFKKGRMLDEGKHVSLWVLVPCWCHFHCINHKASPRGHGHDTSMGLVSVDLESTKKKPGRHAVSCSFFVTPEWRFVDLFDPISCLIQGVREKQYSMIPPPARNNNSVDNNNNNNNNNHTEARATTTETTIATTPLQPPSLQPSAQSSLQQQWQCYEQ